MYSEIHLYLSHSCYVGLFQCRLIVSQMSNTQCELMNWLMFPLALCLVIVVVFPSLEMATLLFMSGVATIAHIHYGVYVVSVTSCSIITYIFKHYMDIISHKLYHDRPKKLYCNVITLLCIHLCYCFLHTHTHMP